LKSEDLIELMESEDFSPELKGDYQDMIEAKDDLLEELIDSYRELNELVFDYLFFVL